MAVLIQDDKLLHVTTRRAWRAWLRKNYRTETDVWLVYNKKHTGLPRVEYNDAVEEALCFGWIDSTVRSLDLDRFAQRYSRRRARSTYSQPNIERLRVLVAEGKVAKDVLPLLPELSMRGFKAPPDILAAIKSNARAWENFRRFPQPYVRVRVAFIDDARERSDLFEKRLAYFIRMTAKGKRYGFGGGVKGDLSLVSSKLQIKDGQSTRLVNAPTGFELGSPVTRAKSADAVLVFVEKAAQLEKHVGHALDAARDDRLCWIAYPKAGQLGTDLNRDVLVQLMGSRGVKPVRQVALDEVWSALRFKLIGGA